MCDAPRPWFEEAFDREYLEIYAHRDVRDAERALAFLKREDVIRSEDRILDLCCGNGRHSMALCRAGHRVHGFDLSHHLLRDFQEHADGSVPLVRGDMRALAYRDGSFDAVLSLFTSFGYFEDDDANWQVLREAARVLRPGGRFLLDFLNALRVRADLRPHSARTLPSGLEVVETRQIDESRRGVVKTVELRRGGKSLRRWEETVRLHTREELTAALAASGLKVSWVCGDFDGSPHGAQSSRLILLATLA